MDKHSDTWSGIIRSVKSPIGFFALVVLCIEAILALVVTQVPEESTAPIVFTMVAALVLVVLCVLLIGLRGPSSWTISNAGEGSREVRRKANPLRGLSDYEVLQQKIGAYADTHPSVRYTAKRGDRIIKKGEKATHLFLLEDGNLIIDDETGRPVEEKELKYPGSIVGEAAVVGASRRRTASVFVHSQQARLVKLSRDALTDLATHDRSFNKALQYLYKLHASRLEKVAIYCGSGVTIDTERCTVLMGDIHGFSRLSEKVTDEMACPFRFKFTDQLSQVASEYDGVFEDQGDGYKVFFRGANHMNRALSSATEMRKTFLHLIEEFATYDETFKGTGLGMGLCTDDFTIATKPNGTSIILGHSVNIAAALSKCRESLSESKIYCTGELVEHADCRVWSFEGPLRLPLEKVTARPRIFSLNTDTKGYLGTEIAVCEFEAGRQD